MKKTEALPMAAMIAVVLSQICLSTLSKESMMSGLSQYVFIVYYDALATLILLPCFLWRFLSGKTRPIAFSFLCKIFGLSLIGKCMYPICFYSGLSYSSITLGAAIENLSPIFTSLIAISLRMEKLDLSKLSDQIKAIGTIVAVLGALIVTFFKGPVLLKPQDSSISAPHKLVSEQSNWLLGCLYLMIGYLLKSLWTILQADTAKSFPDEVALVFFYTLFGTIQTAAASLFLVKGENAWKLHHKIEIISVFYTAFFMAVLGISVQTWCLRKKGAIYMSMFCPLKVALAGVIGFVFLQDGIYLGSVIGSATIVVGFYAVMWAQSENKNDKFLESQAIMESSSLVRKSLPFVAMTAVQFVLIGSVTLTKATMMSGLSQCVYIVYYEALGTIILLPWLVCRCLSGKTLPLNFSLVCRFFGLSLIGSCLSPILLCTGLNFTSVTVVTSIGNLNPIFTFLIAICLRMERLDLRKSTDQLKLFGTFVAVLGAFVVTLYKGPALLATQHLINSARKLKSELPNWPLGCGLLTVGFLLRSIWNILQADIAKLYPDEVTIVFFYNLFGTIQTAIASLFLVKGRSAWQLNSKVEIIAIVYSAFALSVGISTILTWCLRRKGAVFVSMFDPLNVALAVFMGFVFRADGIYLGSVIGSTAIVVGFYAVMWGQAKTTMANKIGGLESGSSQVTPLLQSSHS